MSAPIRILRIINSLEPYGVELGIVDMCRRLTEGYQWAVLSFMGGAVADKLRECGVEVFGPNESRDNSPSMFAMFREVRKAVDSWRPHIVHGHLDRGSILGGWAAKLRGLPSIAHVHNRPHFAPPHFRYGKLAYRLGYRSIGRTAAVVTVSKGIAREFRACTGLSSVVIYNGIDLSRFVKWSGRHNGLRGELSIPDGAIIVGAVGRLHYQKNYPCLLRVASQVAEQTRNVHFVAAGDGTLKQELETYRDELGLRGRFHFLGYRSDVPQLLQETDIFAFTSCFEGFGRAVAEAMATECPVVATDVVGVNEVVEPGQTGYLVPLDHEEELAARIIKLARDPELRRKMGQAGRKRVQEHFSLSSMAAKFALLYAQLASNNRVTSDRI